MSKRYGLNIGVSGIGVYVPPLRVSLESWCEWTGASWPKTQAVVGGAFACQRRLRAFTPWRQPQSCV